MHDKKGCNECKSSKSSYSFIDNKLVVKNTCLKGNQESMETWWANNGNKKSNNDLDIMECHEYTDAAKTLNKTLNYLDEILNSIKWNK